RSEKSSSQKSQITDHEKTDELNNRLKRYESLNIDKLLIELTEKTLLIEKLVQTEQSLPANPNRTFDEQHLKRTRPSSAMAKFLMSGRSNAYHSANLGLTPNYTGPGAQALTQVLENEILTKIIYAAQSNSSLRYILNSIGIHATDSDMESGNLTNEVREKSVGKDVLDSTPLIRAVSAGPARKSVSFLECGRPISPVMRDTSISPSATVRAFGIPRNINKPKLSLTTPLITSENRKYTSENQFLVPSVIRTQIETTIPSRPKT
ncbi:hypothetical protein HK096_000435, partial [Nowakowskiella sp. JEL0078]